MKKYLYILTAFFISLSTISCDDSSDFTAEITSVTPSVSTVYAGHSFKLDYTVSHENKSENVIISLYLLNKEEYDSKKNSADMEKTALLGTDTVNINKSGIMTFSTDVRTPETLENGDYYIEAFVNEGSNETEQNPGFITGETVTLSNEHKNTTNLCIKEFVLEKQLLFLIRTLTCCIFLKQIPEISQLLLV